MFVVVYDRDRVRNAEMGPAATDVEPKPPEAPQPSTDARVVVEAADAGTGDDEEGYGYGV